MINVLVVEDEPTSAAALVEFVGRVPGFAVAGHARTGAEALRRIATDGVDLVMLDIYLPDMSGLDVLRRLRAAGDTVDVVAVTVARDLSTVRAAVAMGAVQYLVKPFTSATVRKKLERYATYRATMAGRDPLLAQQEVDEALAALRDVDRGGLPKGINRESLHAVVAALREAGEGAALSAAEVGRVLGTSRVTARRYLEHLAASGIVLRQSRFGRTGRPETEYRWLPDHQHAPQHGSPHGSPSGPG